MGKIASCRPTSPTRSRPARSSSAPPPSSRSSSRTPSTPARAASTIHVELGGKKQIRVEDDGEGMDAGGRAAGDRAPRDEQDPAGRRPRARSRRSGSAARRCRRSRRCRISSLRTRARGAAERHRDPRQRRGGRRRSSRSARRRARVVEVNDLFYNLPARRKFLKSDGAESAQVSRVVTQLALAYPEVGFTLTSARPDGAAVPAGGVAARSALPALRRPRRSDRGAARRPAASRLERLHRGAGRAGADARAAERLRQPAHRQGPDDRARHHRRLQRRRRSRSAARKCTCSSRCRPTRSTSTCTRRRPRCGSAISRSCTRSCGAALMDALGQGGVPQLQLRPEVSVPDAARRRRCPASWPAARIPNRWVPDARPAAEPRPRTTVRRRSDATPDAAAGTRHPARQRTRHRP